MELGLLGFPVHRLISMYLIAVDIPYSVLFFALLFACNSLAQSLSLLQLYIFASSNTLTPNKFSRFYRFSGYGDWDVGLFAD